MNFLLESKTQFSTILNKLPYKDIAKAVKLTSGYVKTTIQFLFATTTPYKSSQNIYFNLI